ncbi:MAG TPA: S53 family peptidase [Streptosporangiaceae bacterium]|nr:S53 family peptidase [Streptosporangiaceae bacterium]
MHFRSHALIAALAASAACVLLGGGIADAAVVGPGPAGLVVLGNTAPPAGPGSAMPAASRVNVSVLIGHDQAGLAAAAQAISDPASPRYQHYLSTAQVAGEFGATPAQQVAVSGWLSKPGLTVTHHDAFTVDASGTVAQAQSALHVRLALYRPSGGTEQVVADKPMSVPAAIASSVSTIQVSQATVSMTPHERLAPVPAHPQPLATVKGKCSAYYGQVQAARLPGAYGRTLNWAPCGYLPQQLQGAYGATGSGLTGAGASVAILSEDNDTTALSDANRWAGDRHFPPFKPGQFSTNITRGVPNGTGDVESALDVEAAHGMAPAARVTYVAGNGKITGDRLLDALDTVVTYHIADVVTSSWYIGWLPQPKSVITAWEGVLQRAAVEGITVNFASGDAQLPTKIQYPGADPWITAVGGTSLAIGAQDNYLWETGWVTDVALLNKSATAWNPTPPGTFFAGTTGGISSFAEPFYQQGVVSGNVINGSAKRAVPDVSDLGDFTVGYQIGYSYPSKDQLIYVNAVNGGTSLSSPLFTGFEADLIQGRHIALGFANPALYNVANTSAFHDVTSSPQGQGFTEATVYGPAYGQRPSLSTMGLCATTPAHQTCGAGYDTTSGIGSPGPSFFSSFGSHPVP